MLVRGLSILVLTLALLAVAAPLAAQQAAASAEEGAPSELFLLGFKVGGASFSYREDSSRVDGRYNGKVGLGELTGSIRIFDRIRFVLTFTGALAGEDTEEWDRDFDSAGNPAVSEQENDLKVTFLLFEPDFRYRVFRHPNIDLDVILGWGVFYEKLKRTNLVVDKAKVAGSYTDTYSGHGPRIGAAARFSIPPLPPKLRFFLDATYNNFIGVNGDSDFLDDGTFTRGYAFRYNAGFTYQITPAFGFGFGYQGILVELDKSDSVDGGTGTVRQGGRVPANSSRIDALYLNFTWAFGR